MGARRETPSAGFGAQCLSAALLCSSLGAEEARSPIAPTRYVTALPMPVVLPTPPVDAARQNGAVLPAIDVRALGLNPVPAPATSVTAPERLQEASRSENWLQESLAALRSEELGRERRLPKRTTERQNGGRLNEDGTLDPMRLGWGGDWHKPRPVPSSAVSSLFPESGRTKEVAGEWKHPTVAPNPYLTALPLTGVPAPTPWPALSRPIVPSPLPTPSPMPPVYEREKDPAYRALPRF